MDVETIKLIFLGCILIQASIIGVTAGEISEKDREVPKLANQGNNLEETAAVRDLSLKNVILQNSLQNEDIKELRIKRKSHLETCENFKRLQSSSDTTYKVKEFSQSCYLFVLKKVEWWVAREECKDWGARLVAIETDNENEILSAWTQRIRNGYVSIGGQWNGRDSFYWVETDAKMEYQNFAPGQGLNGADAPYVYMMPSGKWANYDEKAAAFLCESDARNALTRQEGDVWMA